MKIYKMRASLVEDPKLFWREFEINSEDYFSTVAYILISSFELMGTHIFNFDVDGRNIQFLYEEDDSSDMSDFIFQPHSIQLDYFDFQVGQTFSFVYDFGSNWEFNIEIKDVIEVDIPKKDEKLYPRILNGRGKCIIEDIWPEQLIQIAKLNKRKMGAIDIYPVLMEEEECEQSEFMDVRHFDVPENNKKLRKDIRKLRIGYETDWDED